MAVRVGDYKFNWPCSGRCRAAGRRGRPRRRCARFRRGEAASCRCRHRAGPGPAPTPRIVIALVGGLPRSRVACLPAYSAYLAYVENDMAMKLRRKRKTGCYRVLRVTKKHGVSHDQNFLSLVKIDVSDKSVRTALPTTAAELPSPLPTLIVNVGRGSPTIDGHAIMRNANPPPQYPTESAHDEDEAKSLSPVAMRS